MFTQEHTFAASFSQSLSTTRCFSHPQSVMAVLFFRVYPAAKSSSRCRKAAARRMGWSLFEVGSSSHGEDASAIEIAVIAAPSEDGSTCTCHVQLADPVCNLESEVVGRIGAMPGVGCPLAPD